VCGSARVRTSQPHSSTICSTKSPTPCLSTYTCANPHSSRSKNPPACDLPFGVSLGSIRTTTTYARRACAREPASSGSGGVKSVAIVYGFIGYDCIGWRCQRKDWGLGEKKKKEEIWLRWIYFCSCLQTAWTMCGANPFSRVWWYSLL
jgi:hypothetical protein